MLCKHVTLIPLWLPSHHCLEGSFRAGVMPASPTAPGCPASPAGTREAGGYDFLIRKLQEITAPVMSTPFILVRRTGFGKGDLDFE